MRKIHLLCNSHLDPSWLWPWEEGATEAVSSFRVAADMCEKYDGFVFNHNESILYEWIEEFDPELFKRIQRLVKEGKWKIMGGWYLQPDCNMPTGESILRHIRTGRDYFKEKFGVEPTTAINFDSFGHSKGLVQILSKTGYDSYIFMRGGFITLDDYMEFNWKGFDGSEILTHKMFVYYSTKKGMGLAKLKLYLDQHPEWGENNMIVWGIGNHGGGVSRIDVEAINKFASECKTHEIFHSDCESYIKTVDRTKLPEIDKSLVHIMVGCYTSIVEIKQAHRRIENKLARLEKMLLHSGVEYDKSRITDIEKNLMYLQFHDSLPGTFIRPAAEAALRTAGSAEDMIDKLSLRAFMALTSGQEPSKDGKLPLLVYSPYPYETEMDIEAEFQLEFQNYTEGEFTICEMYDEDGNKLATQNEKEFSSLNMDWRKNIVFHAKLKPMQMNRFDCKFTVMKNYNRIKPYDETDDAIVYENDKIKISISKKTGLINEYIVDGKPVLKENSGALTVFFDDEDPWSGRVSSYPDKRGVYTLISDEEANRYLGHPNATVSNVRVIENGDVRLKVQCVFRYEESFAVVTYVIPKVEKDIEVIINSISNVPNVMVKYVLNSACKDGKFYGQTMFGTQELEKEQNEVVYQKWCGLEDGTSGMYVINNGMYGGSSDGEELRLSLFRTPVYACHPVRDKEYHPSDRRAEHIDLGERYFRFKITGDKTHIDSRAQEYNELPYILPYYPSGAGEKKPQMAQVDNCNVLLTCCREEKDGIIVRLYNSQDSAQTAKFTGFGADETINFTPFEVKTFMVGSGKLTETDMLGNVLK